MGREGRLTNNELNGVAPTHRRWRYVGGHDLANDHNLVADFFNPRLNRLIAQRK